MMGDGCACGAGGVIVVVALLFVLALGLVGLVVWGIGGTIDRRRPRSPGEELRERYARGGLSRQQYRVALVDILKDRYIRGEIELDEYEARLDLLLHERAEGRTRGLEQPERPASLS